MRAAVYEGPDRMVVGEVPDPVPGPNEVLLAVTAAGICGTDRHIVGGELGVRAGTVPGHEIAGRIIDHGRDVEGWEIGERVVSYGQVTCGACRPCREGATHRCRHPQVLGMTRQGGFAERVAVPAQCLVRIPALVPDVLAAITPDAIATPYHALVTVGRMKPGETVVVLGAGGLGLHAVALARMLGAERVVAVDPAATARTAAMAMGADEVLDPTAHDDPARELYALTSGATLAVECVGRGESVELGMDALAPGGRLVIVGVGHDRPRLPPLIRFVAAEASILGSFGSTMEEIETVLDLVADGRLDVAHSVSREVALDDVPGVFREQPTPGRTVITPRS